MYLSETEDEEGESPKTVLRKKTVMCSTNCFLADVWFGRAGRVFRISHNFASILHADVHKISSVKAETILLITAEKIHVRMCLEIYGGTHYTGGKERCEKSSVMFR